MITPTYLKPGDTIGIVSPAKSIVPDVITMATAIFENAGFKVRLGKHATGSYHQYAGTDLQRAADFQEMLDDASVKLILCSRGGYGSVRIIDKLDFGGFKRSPKWIAGYSDITIFHSYVYSMFGVEGIHSVMPLDFIRVNDPGRSVQYLIDTIQGKHLNYSFNSHPLNRKGNAKAVLVGGNLSILCSLLGSKGDPDTDGRILFIEDVGENLYRLDRMMWTLKRAGKLDGLAGLVVGGLTGMTDNDIKFGLTAEEIVAEAVAAYDYPVCFNFPAGHQKQNFPLILGRELEFEVQKNISLNFNSHNHE
nr:LD-carboxypeptidase [Bacteroidota bacterium]